MIAYIDAGSVAAVAALAAGGAAGVKGYMQMRFRNRRSSTSDAVEAKSAEVDTSRTAQAQSGTPIGPTD